MKNTVTDLFDECDSAVRVTTPLCGWLYLTQLMDMSSIWEDGLIK